MSIYDFSTGYSGLLGKDFKLTYEEVEFITNRVISRIDTEYGKINISGISEIHIQNVFNLLRERRTRRDLDEKTIEDMRKNIIDSVISNISEDVISHYIDIDTKKTRSIWDGGRRRFAEDNSYKAVSHDHTRSDHMFDEPRF